MSIIALTGLDLVEFTPPALAERDPRPVFYIRTPTFQMKDKMAALLFHAGFIPATKAQSRGVLINALYDHYDEATADDHATFLESFWTRQEIHEQLIEAWQIQESTRLFDLVNGAKGLEQSPLPPAPYSMREQARQAAIITNILENDEAYRSYQGRFMSIQAEEDAMLMRLFIDRWEGVDGSTAARDGMGRLTDDCLEQLRGWLEDVLGQHGGADAWESIKTRVKQQFGAPGGLEKNFDSPPGTNSSPTGSPKPSGASASSDGSSTTSSIEPTPASVSPATSPASRNSRSARTGKTRKSGPTAAP